MRRTDCPNGFDSIEHRKFRSEQGLLSGKRYFWIVISIGVLATVICGFAGIKAYSTSRESHLQSIQQHNRVVSTQLAIEIDETPGPLSTSEIIDRVLARWRSLPLIRQDSYLCIIGADATILAHSTHPEAVGADVTNLKIPYGPRGSAATIGQLVATKKSWVGENINLRGNRQVAAYGYSEKLDGLIVVHTAESSYGREFQATALPWVVAYSIAVFGLWPVCLLLAHIGFRRYHHRMVEADRQLHNQLNELEHIYATAPVGLCQVDTQLRFVHINEELARINGRSVQQHLGVRIRDVLPDLANTIEPIYRKVIQTCEPELNVEITRTLTEELENNPQYYLASYHPIINKHGQVIRIGTVVKDITQRKQTEKALAKSETLFRTLVENSYDVINLFSADGEVLYSSPSIKRVLGYDPQERLNTTGVDIIHPDDVEQAAREFEKCLRRPGRVGHFTYRLRHKNGSYRTVEITGTNMLEDPAVGAMVSIFRDITDRRRAERALQQSEERFRTLCTHAPVGIFMMSKDGNCIYVNQKSTQIVGVQEEKLLGTGWSDYLHPDDKDWVLAKWLSSVEIGSRFTADNRFKKPDGEIAWVHCDCIPLDDPQGQPVGFIGTIIDISQRIQSQQALELSEERYRTLVENATEAIVVLDVDLQKFVDCNSNALKLFKSDKETLLSLSVADLSPTQQPDGRDSKTRAEELVGRALNGQTPVFEWTHFDTSGREFVCEIRLVRLPSSNRRLVRGSVLDITERKRSEVAMREQQSHLAHVSRLSTMGEMVAGIAHEINQPLASIANFANACTHTLKAGDQNLSVLIDWTDEIRAEASRAAQIIKRFGNFTQKSNEDHALIDLNKLICDTVDLVSFQAKKSQICTSINLTDEETTVFGDRIQLQQVILNLLRNAFEAVESEPADRRFVSVTSTTHSNQVEVEVFDTGYGIVEENTAMIFEAFFSTKPNGMGMGLAISRTIIQEHEGQLTAKSDPQSGTFVRFCLPGQPNKYAKCHSTNPADSICR